MNEERVLVLSDLAWKELVKLYLLKFKEEPTWVCRAYVGTLHPLVQPNPNPRQSKLEFEIATPAIAKFDKGQGKVPNSEDNKYGSNY